VLHNVPCHPQHDEAISARGHCLSPRFRITQKSCLVLDVSLPGLDGLELQKQLAVEHSDTGMGLRISRTIIEARGGRFWLRTTILAEHVFISLLAVSSDAGRLDARSNC
jgi:hypothetical protein